MSAALGDPEVLIDLAALELDVQMLDVAERALLAQHYASVEAWRVVLELCRARPGQPVTRGLRLLEARARFGLGDRDAGSQLVEEILVEQPQHGLALSQKAQFLAKTGQVQAARAVLRDLIEATPDFPGALTTLAQSLLPGPPYREVLNVLHQQLRPETYLEIGVEHGTTLQLARYSEVIVGVDPVERTVAHRLPTGARLYHQTSDAFFAEHTREDVLGARRVDLAFIDGMHWFEFVLRDFENVERWCHADSLLVLHDCLPVAPVAALRERRSSFWVGDCWKAVDHLRRERRDLKISIVPCYPSGLVMIENVAPHRLSPRTPERSSFAADLAQEPYPDATGQWPLHLPLIENSERGLSKWLAQSSAFARARARAWASQ